MKGEAKKIIKFLDGSDKRFIIPVYQRNYSWQKKQCEKLFNDLKNLINKSEVPHFFFFFVSSQAEGEGKEDYLIIDGQQRLTTISILLVAIVKLLEEKRVSTSDPRLEEKITKKHLVDEYQDDQRKIRLKPIKDDCRAFDALFGSEDDYVLSSNVTKNFLYFKERIIEENIDVSMLYEAISRLEIIDIFLHKEDDPQLIFESLNSTGLALEEGDKIRNFILMGLKPKLQEDYYEKYWNKIEKLTHYQVSEFFKDYLTLKLGKSVVIRDIYFTFKEYVQENNIETEDCLKDLLNFAKLYEIIVKPVVSNKSYVHLLLRLQQLEFTVIHPLLLSILELERLDVITEVDVSESLRAIESYLLRRLIVGLPTNALNKVFATIARDIEKRVQQSSSTYVEVLKYLMLSKEESSRYPKDEEFIHSLFNKNIYAMSSKNKMYLFSCLENGDSKEQAQVIEKLKDGTYSIEHVMPQTLSREWKIDLGHNHEEIHEKYLHTLPNLTLTAYNSVYSNKPFKDKLTIKDGFKDSNLRLNKYISSCTQWTEQEILERKNLLAERAKEIWSLPISSYMPPEKITDDYTLQDDIDFTGRSLASFDLFDTTYKVDSWKSMQVHVVSELYEKYADVIKDLIDDPNFDDLKSTSDQLANQYHVINGEFAIYANCSTKYKISMLRELFSRCGLDQIDLGLSLKVV